jgi:ribosome-associated heat shock protein Hsp15
MRIDKYIWAVRLAKTRSIASDLCSSEKIKLNNSFCKPSKEVKIGDVIEVKNVPIWRTYKVIDLPKSRIGAPLVKVNLIETTDPLELEKLHLIEEANRLNKSLGQVGRPTKKDRRDLDDMMLG